MFNMLHILNDRRMMMMNFEYECANADEEVLRINSMVVYSRQGASVKLMVGDSADLEPLMEVLEKCRKTNPYFEPEVMQQPE